MERTRDSGRSDGGPAGLLDVLADSGPFRRVARALAGGDPGVLAGGVTGSLLSFLVTALVRALPEQRLLLGVPGEPDAEAATADLALLGAPAARLLTAEDSAAERLALVEALAAGRAPGILVASVRALVDPAPARESLERGRLILRIGQALAREKLLERMTGSGLVREGTVLEPGQCSVRGDVVDLWPEQESRPLRVEFLDDTLDGLRRFDPASQISVEVLEEASIHLAPTEDGGAWGSILEHLEPDRLLVMRDPGRLQQALERHLARLGEEQREDCAAVWSSLQARRSLLASRLKAPASEAVNLGGRVITPEGTSFEHARETLERVSRGKTATLLCFDTDPERKRFFEALEEGARQERGRDLGRRNILTMVGRLAEGFHCPLLGIAALGHHELFAVPRQRRDVLQEEEVSSRPLDSFIELRDGDYVVHLAHGIARFEGLVEEERSGATQEFLALGFRDGVRLLVPAVRIDLVQRYVGGRGESPELSRLGGRSWARRKEAVADAVGDLAAELLEFHALRARATGIAHPADSPWQQEFEAAFPFTLTNDQASALEAIKADMESGRPMDRLVCGDVGFGKTEVAMRAAFKCVIGGRQVAMLVPTTVLAQQHWNVFRERMADYPVVIECLSRFRTKREQAGVVEGLADGSVDVVVGTHRLVQPDVGIADLGLLIIDEEQRFGVEHKEHLRRVRRNVDVLTLSATPIPRTLHQALLGIRDISSLTQAPRGRHAIKTEVTLRDDALIRNGILRELDRDGQVFFVHNRVQSIHGVATRLMELVPEARFMVAHGQMPERQLERAMLAFLDQEADVLVCTSIIESGLDIPTVNTIFVDQAHMFGLSDLHQLRGRVGRYRHQAYATFMVGQDRVLSEVAEKRLRAIEEFSELGAGFRVAMRDMEIRGVGNILGPEQSGHIASVGYELYCRLLEAAVKRTRMDDLVAPREVEINLDLTALLPPDYVPGKRQRIDVYRRLARARALEDFEGIVAELRDRFGPPPEEAREFVLLARVRAILERHHIHRLEWMEGYGLVLRSERLRRLVAALDVEPDQARMLDRQRVLLLRDAPFGRVKEVLGFLEQHLPGEPAGLESGVESEAVPR